MISFDFEVNDQIVGKAKKVKDQVGIKSKKGKNEN